MTSEHPNIILASASPRRQQLVAAMGLSFRIAVSNIDESGRPGESPEEMVQRLGLAKAAAIAPEHPRALIISADTIVVLDGQILGKPATEDAAVAMLTRLRGRRHMVYSGLVLSDMAHGRRSVQAALTPVRMRAFTDQEIADYVATGDPMDKAGAYAIQHQSFSPIAVIEGCYANVMGLPMCHLYRAMTEWLLEVPIHPCDCCPIAIKSGCSWSDTFFKPSNA